MHEVYSSPTWLVSLNSRRGGADGGMKGEPWFSPFRHGGFSPARRSTDLISTITDCSFDLSVLGKWEISG